MRGYGQFCPVAKAAEIVAERWTPLVLRELLSGSHTFNDLHRGVPLMSRTLLAQRLEELRDADVVERRPRARGRGWDYRLTPAGTELQPLIQTLGEWGRRWARRQVERGGDLDPGLLMWDIHRRLNVDRLPTGRTVVRFDFRSVPLGSRCKRTWWLVLEPPDVDLCLKEPGFPVDLVVEAELAALTKAWVGEVRLVDAIRAGLVRLDGPRPLVQAFPGWLALSGFAAVPRPARAAR